MDPPQEEASRTAAREKKKRQRDSLSPEEARVKRQKNTEAKRKARGAIGEHNDITSQEFQTTERRYQQMCRDAEMLYLAPITGRTNVELKAHTRKRRSNMTKMCDLYSDVNSEKFKATEDEYRKKCADAGVPYMAPDIDRDATIEDKRHTTRRRTAMTRSYTQRNDINDPAFEDEESRFRVACSQCYVDYVPPTPVAGNASQELKVNTKSRRAAMSRQINKEPPVQTFDELGIPNIEVNIDDPVKLAAKQLCNTMVGDRTHMGNVCLICDRSSIGNAFFDYISKAHVLRHRDRLSIESYEQKHGSLHELVKEYYAIQGLEGLLLSPRAPRKGDGFVCCSTCRHGLKASRAESRIPPKYSIANNFATGPLPESLAIHLEDSVLKGLLRSLKSRSPPRSGRHSLGSTTRSSSVACLRPLIPWWATTTSPHHGNEPIIFLTQVRNTVDHVRTASNVASDIYVVMGWSMTPNQKRIVREGIYLDLLSWFIKESGHGGYAGMSVPEECPKLQLIKERDTSHNTDEEGDAALESQEVSETYYFSSDGDPSSSTSIFDSTRTFAAALWDKRSARSPQG